MKRDAKIRVMTVLGTRPEVIKMAPVIQELETRTTRFDSIVVATGQHREMLDQTMAVFGIVPRHDLNVMRPEQTLSGLAARLLEELDSVLCAEKPDWVLVQGDTTTVAAASLAAYHRQVKVGHVEAGLRTGDKSQPFPEEMNRRLTDILADLCFAPTEGARSNLLREGLPSEAIVLTGNTVIDALLMTAQRVGERRLDACFNLAENKRLLLVTAHRRENFGLPLSNICEALRRIVDQRDDVQIVYPVHPNPNVEGPVREKLEKIDNISLIAPVDYESMVWLLTRCHVVLTDSGGLQEESPSLNKPVLVLREKTERPEAVTAGAARLVGTNPDRIVAETLRLLDNPDAYAAMASVRNPFGDGLAAQRIVDALAPAVSVSQPHHPVGQLSTMFGRPR